MFTMIRKLLLALGVGTVLVFTGANTAFAADEPPANTRLTYQQGSSENVVMLSSNLSNAERQQIDSYVIRVQIANQPQRLMTVSKLPATLYNVVPGTRIHAYLTVKGDFGTSPEYDSGEYTQGEGVTDEPSTSASPTPSQSQPTVSPSPTASASPTPSSAQPTPTVTSTPQVTTSAPGTTPVPSPSQVVSNPGVVANFAASNLFAISIIAIVTFIVLSGVVLLRRRRRG